MQQPRRMFRCMEFALAASVLLVVASKASATRGLAASLNPLTLIKTTPFVAGAPEPKWYKQFTIQFNETTRIFITKRTVGTWYYDAINNMEAVYRANGNGDRYCGSIHPLTQTPCTHVVTGGKRYLVFPDLGECCMCCTAQQGCGIVSPSWLQGASFEGTVEIQGLSAYKWRRDGLQPNYWYTTADDAQIPLELDQMPNDRQSFWPGTFLEGPPPPDVFAMPANCKATCPLASVCTIAAAVEDRTVAAASS